MIFLHKFFFVATRFFLVAVLLATFSLHAAIFDHHHDERIFTGIFQSITHGEEKKWFTDFLPTSARMFALVPALFLSLFFFAPSTFFVYDPIRQALRRGVIHPKLYA